MTLTLKTARANLPLIAPGQAGKTITHNEALLMIDALMHLTVLEVVNTPPEPEIDNGQCVRIGDIPSGIFAGHANDVAQYDNNVWRYFTPKPGWQAYNLAEEQLDVFDGQSWNPLSDKENVEVTRLGIGTPPDPTLTLNAYGDASLFGGGSGHQVKINRTLNTDTAALLFTTAHAGQAEIGLTGSEGLSIKLSDDGQNWEMAMTFDPNTGVNFGVPLKRQSHVVWDAENAPGLMYDRGVISNYTDINTLVERGIYIQTSNYGASTGTNYPRFLAGVLMVYDMPFGVQQTYRLYGGAANNEGDAIFVRSLYGGIWRAWRKLVSEAA